MLGIFIKEFLEPYAVRVYKRGFVSWLAEKLVEASLTHILRQYSSDGKEEIMAGWEVQRKDSPCKE